MAKNLKGVGGVLGSLISPEPGPTPQPEPPAPAAEAEAAEPPAPLSLPAGTRPPGRARTPARRGRPPGKKAGEGADKEKVTLRLSKELMDEYREWSWDERCQLGELVERALSQYHKHRLRQKSQ